MAISDAQRNRARTRLRLGLLPVLLLDLSLLLVYVLLDQLSAARRWTHVALLGVRTLTLFAGVFWRTGLLATARRVPVTLIGALRADPAVLVWAVAAAVSALVAAPLTLALVPAADVRGIVVDALTLALSLLAIVWAWRAALRPALDLLQTTPPSREPAAGARRLPRASSPAPAAAAAASSGIGRSASSRGSSRGDLFASFA